MNDETRAVIIAEIQEAIRETVNGKIDGMRRELCEHNAKHEADMEEMKPYMQAASGVRVIFKFFIFAGSIAAAWVAIEKSLGLHFVLNI